MYVFDGATVQMPDTPDNQAAYPQNPIQKPGLGFPIARLGAVFCLACGAVIDLDICRYAGKGQGEVTMFRKLMGLFKPGDVVLGDRMMCNWINFLSLQRAGIDCVTRLAADRATDFRLGERLGPCDHIVTWTKPTTIHGMPYRQYHALPESVRVRECRVKLSCRGFRSKVIVLATTLLDAVRYPKEDLAELYRARWNAELDLRSLKTTLQMDVLRCKTPELVRKEVWTHVLAYNLIRTVMAQAAHKHGLPPREISFKGAMQTLEAFAPLINSRTLRKRRLLFDQLLDAIASHQVGDRPGRFEPRRLKRRQKKYDLMTSPRHVLKDQMAKGVVLK